MPTDVPQVTVVLPVGPSTEDLRSRIGSVSAQTVPHVEVLTVGPQQEALRLDLAHVRQVPSHGSGLVGALNDALRVANGEMLAFLMPGWRWHPSYLTRQLDELARNDRTGASLTVSGIASPDGVVVPTAVWPRGDIAAETLEHDPPCYLSALVVRRQCIEDDFDDQFVFLAAKDFVWNLAWHQRFCSVLELLAWGPEPHPDQNALALEQSKLAHKHRGPIEHYLGPSDLTARDQAAAPGQVQPVRLPGVVQPTGLRWLQHQWQRLTYWPWSWAMVTALTLPIIRLGLFGDDKVRGRFASLQPPSRPAQAPREEAYLVGIYLSSRRCPQTGRTFPSTGFDLLSNWYHSAREHGLRAIVLHDGIDAETIERYTTPDFSFEAVTLPPGEESTNDVRFRLFEDFLTRRPEITRVVFTDVTDVTIRANLFPAMKPEHIYVGGEATFNGGSLYIWRVFGKAYRWSDRMRLFSLLDKPLLNCGILGGSRDQVIMLLRGINEELDLSRPEVDANMVALNLAAYRLFEPETIVTGHPLHNRFKSYEPGPGVYFLHK